MPEEDINSYQPEPGQSKSLVPFAHTAAHDWWGFWNDGCSRSPPVVYCPGDETYGVYYASTFEAALFRQILDFASSANFEPISEGGTFVTLAGMREALTFWRELFKPWFSGEWIKTIERLKTLSFTTYRPHPKRPTLDYQVLITPQEAKDVFQRLVNWDLIDTKFLWQQ
jgi:hypothetical protein